MIRISCYKDIGSNIEKLCNPTGFVTQNFDHLIFIYLYIFKQGVYYLYTSIHIYLHGCTIYIIYSYYYICVLLKYIYTNILLV